MASTFPECLQMTGREKKPQLKKDLFGVMVMLMLVLKAVSVVHAMQQ